jgi:uncharacterized protein YgiM (DUF1202 family)
MMKRFAIILAGISVLVLFFCTVARAETTTDAAQRQEHEKAADKKLKELNKKMDELAAESKKAEGKTQVEMNRLYEDFKKQQGVAAKDLEELRKSTNEAWEKAKKNMDKSIDNLNGLYERSKANVKTKDKGEVK